MPDVADLAQDHMEREDSHRIAASKRPAGPAAKGSCHYCDEPLAPPKSEDEPPRRWCDAKCRDSWEHEQRLRR